MMVRCFCLLCCGWTTLRYGTLTLTDLYDPIRADLEVAMRLFDEELLTDLPVVNSLCDRVGAYRGKMVRPALLLLCGSAVGELQAAHRTLAAVVEMVHVATLVHDDVLDEADARRGKPSVRATEGNTAAVLLGDYLISHAFHLCSSLDSQHASRRIGATTNTVCEGELLQNALRGSLDVTEDLYLDIIRRKTGALTAVACELGAHTAGGDRKFVQRLAEFGMQVGTAFQIMDDLLDITGEQDEVGKTLAIDFASGKLTLPVIHCLKHASRHTAKRLQQGLRGETNIDKCTLREWLLETQSLDYARSLANNLVEKACCGLGEFELSQARHSLHAMAEFAVCRRF